MALFLLKQDHLNKGRKIVCSFEQGQEVFDRYWEKKFFYQGLHKKSFDCCWDGKCLISADAGIANGLRKANCCREGKPGRGGDDNPLFYSQLALIHCNGNCDLNDHCRMQCQLFETFGHFA